MPVYLLMTLCNDDALHGHLPPRTLMMTTQFHVDGSKWPYMGYHGRGKVSNLAQKAKCSTYQMCFLLRKVTFPPPK